MYDTVGRCWHIIQNPEIAQPGKLVCIKSGGRCRIAAATTLHDTYSAAEGLTNYNAKYSGPLFKKRPDHIYTYLLVWVGRPEESVRHSEQKRGRIGCSRFRTEGRCRISTQHAILPTSYYARIVVIRNYQTQAKSYLQGEPQEAGWAGYRGHL